MDNHWQFRLIMQPSLLQKREIFPIGDVIYYWKVNGSNTGSCYCRLVPLVFANTPSGLRSITASAGVLAGTTVTVAILARWRKMLRLIPKS